MARKRRKPVMTGILQKHKKGFGFVTVEGEENDIYISKDGMNGAMNGDTVKVELSADRSGGDRREGVIVGFEDRGLTEVVGTFQKSKRFGFVVPDDKRLNDDVFIRRKYFGQAEKGDKVVAKIVKYPDANNSAEGKITQVISKYGQPGGDIKALIRQYNMFPYFPENVEKEAVYAAGQGIKASDTEGRRDLRELTVFTIDGADSKDFDDAVSCSKAGNGNFVLGVHIADVSHYVADDGELDREALKRGNSVYLIDQVIPMLPVELSNGMCSLNPDEDRLTLTCQMEIDPLGQVVKHEIFESVIHSDERMVYGDVSDIIEDKDDELKEKYKHIYKDIMLMNELADLLRRKRESRGSLDFDLDEARITLDEKGIPVSIGIAERRVANKMIEEFMLLANEVVAEHFFWMEAPFVYRVHETPTAEKIEELATFLKGFGIRLDASKEVHPIDLKRILEKVKDQTYENVVNTVMLRSMQKAVYDTECKGHFGLSLKYYCHFTSPIRRYPDLMIHRIIKAYIHGGMDVKAQKYYKKKADEAAKTASGTERRAIELERQVEDMKKAEYLSYHVGEEFEGVISGVTAYGIYVELANTVEGMARLEYMNDDYYDYDPGKYRVIGRRTNKIYALGDQVKIKVHNVNLEDVEVDFKII
ncbi:MAG: ribonuclease R [Eubacteriaceae bacterium]|nr:ribonuclease R [Eubacteriaceae bacterium]